ncbi:MAG: exodeoxyribonuclease VII small subunit [Verrucomicrobiota bacterium]
MKIAIKRKINRAVPTLHSELDVPRHLPYDAPVPNPAKSTLPNAPVKTGIPFEEALQKLETLVEAMESGDLPLESLLARYEEGVKLTKICQDKLAEAELKIQQLEKTAGGELRLKPLAAELADE